MGKSMQEILMQCQKEYVFKNAVETLIERELNWHEKIFLSEKTLTAIENMKRYKEIWEKMENA